MRNENYWEGYKINKPLSGLLVCRLIMSLAERLSSKFHICPRSFASRPNVHFSLSRGHYQPTYQPPEGVYLLNIGWLCHLGGYVIIAELRRPERQAEPHKHPVYGNLRKPINEFSHGYHG